MSGATVVAASPTTSVHGQSVEGRILVFTRPASGWSGLRHESASLMPPGRSATYDGFGESVAISGDTVVVGAPGSGFGGDRDPGRAYVYIRPAGGWHGHIAPAATLTAAGGGAGDAFGYSVAISGGTIVVGAPFHGHGAVYVFARRRGAQTQAATLNGPRGSLGFAVGVSGSTIVAGAPVHRGGGAAYAFVRRGRRWAGQRLTHPAAARQVGYSVAIAGATIAVGAPDFGAHGAQPQDFVYTRTASGWGSRPAAVLAAPSPAKAGTCGSHGDRVPYADLGRSLAISGDRIVVNAGQQAVNSTWLGTACIFTRPAGGWSGTITQAASVERPPGSGSMTSHFSFHVAADAGTILVSSDGLRAGNVLSVGAVFVY